MLGKFTITIINPKGEIIETITCENRIVCDGITTVIQTILPKTVPGYTWPEVQ